MKLAVLGAGSWGTALCLVLAPSFEQVRLWVYEPDLCERIQGTRENDVYLPGFRIPQTVCPVIEAVECVAGADIVLAVVPSHHLRGVLEQAAPAFEPSMLFVSATKGVENTSLKRMSEVVAEVAGRRFTARVGVLSGPTFAREVAAGEPAAVAIASTDADLARQVQRAFSGPTLRLYTNSDPIGVEIGAALKNVIAIAAGVCQGLGLGSNSRAALITRGLVEITRLATAMGGRPQTLAGLAGLGDLVLTCTGELSRNRKVGLELASGKTLSSILAEMRMVAEGVQTTWAALDLSRKYAVDLPITGQMGAILNGDKSPAAALRELMDRSLKGE